jgi:hypothetical protein
MGMIGRLFRRSAGQRDDPWHNTPRSRHAETGCHAGCISPDWLQSIRSLGDSFDVSRGGLTVPVSALSPLRMSSTWLHPDLPNEDRRKCG